jgi:hypothetical protein
LPLIRAAKKDRVLYSKDVQTTESSFAVEEPTIEPLDTSIVRNNILDSVANSEDIVSEIDLNLLKSVYHVRVFFFYYITYSSVDMDEDEKRVIIQSEHFSDFVTKSTKLIERALTDKMDLFRDYTQVDDDSRYLVVQ